MCAVYTIDVDCFINGLISVHRAWCIKATGVRQLFVLQWICLYNVDVGGDGRLAHVCLFSPINDIDFSNIDKDHDDSDRLTEEWQTHRVEINLCSLKLHPRKFIEMYDSSITQQ